MTEDEALALMDEIDRRCRDIDDCTSRVERNVDGGLYVDQEKHHYAYDEFIAEVVRALGWVRVADRYAEAEDRVGWWYS